MTAERLEAMLATTAADDLERRLRRLGPLVATARRTFPDPIA